MRNNDRAEEYYERGHSLYDSGRYEEALAAYEDCLRYNPNHQLTLVGKFSVLQKSKRSEEALRFYDAIYGRIDNEKARKGLLYMKAHILYYDLHRPEEALQQVRLVTDDSSNPRYEDGLFLMALALNDLQRYEESLASSIKACRLYPSNPRFYRAKGTTLFYLHRYEEALVAFDKTISLKPLDSMGHYNRGVALNKLGRYKEALVASEQALRIDPNNVTYLQQKEVVLRALNR